MAVVLIHQLGPDMCFHEKSDHNFLLANLIEGIDLCGETAALLNSVVFKWLLWDAQGGIGYVFSP